MKHIPRKRFGQNFLTDKTVLHDIISAIGPQPGDLMVEIGPGLGAMTSLLLGSLERLHVVELDRDLVERLSRKFDPARLIVHSGDALAFDFRSLLPSGDVQAPPGSGSQRSLRVVGNLPYNISSPLLFHLADFADIVVDQHFMLQKEVVERMVAEPGSKVYGRLSVMLQWRYQMDMLMVVPPTAFDPPPKVESAIVRMIPLREPLACDPALLGQVVTKAFSQRRKVLRNCLSGMFTEEQIRDAGIDPQARPETVAVEGFVGLARMLGT
ncbi:16S rRNA (adenine(1518)-N(6)/adenine(1519)-N(6))-dimethyltransferase RsmA [Lacisediminimonas profundi]|uniref:16S rRNA (adenine(1518)-N(6)/adenine(1519)-N(6))- dimethyltransferase RsmA n=1 Tax=Lacisediminimonas profundi TaxID=2603856 RepID=UPI00124B2024|nr:16S rRNA (adenine(1518)-N(6)/adenine(1519)-N(6))-dimethyltransferase RsmA [Lacisediminimonas profundi]